MQDQIEYECAQHADPYDCPDAVVTYVRKFDEYGLIIHDGGRSHLIICYCPWCGAELPVSKRETWFAKLQALGIDPGSDSIPPEYESDAWYR